MTMYHMFYFIPGVFIILSILFIYEKIGPNEMVGIRVGKAVWNDENWYKVHRFAGWSWLITSVATFLYLALLYFCKSYIYPDLDVKNFYLLGFTFFFIIGYVVIPLVYNVSMPDSHTEEETSFNFDQLKSNYIVAVYVWISVILIIGVAPMAFNKVAPNRSYGFKTSKTLSSEENWYKANQFSGRATIIASCITIGSILLMKLFLAKKISLFDNGFVYLMLLVLPQTINIIYIVLYHIKL